MSTQRLFLEEKTSGCRLKDVWTDINAEAEEIFPGEDRRDMFGHKVELTASLSTRAANRIGW